LYNNFLYYYTIKQSVRKGFKLETIQKRERYYALFSRLLLSEVQKEILKKIEKSDEFEILFPTYSKWEKRKKENLEKIITHYLNVDFTDISILHLIPYESFYTREDAMIESGGANPVVEIYNEQGFRANLDKARAVSPDHIGIELEFMKILIENEKEAIERGKDELAKEFKKLQKDFLKNHILKFAPMYLINVAEEARTPFYKDLAKSALEFLLEDLEYLSNEERV